jgi:hypothetical protein
MNTRIFELRTYTATAGKIGVRKPNYISNVAGFHWSGSQRSN